MEDKAISCDSLALAAAAPQERRKISETSIRRPHADSCFSLETSSLSTTQNAAQKEKSLSEALRGATTHLGRVILEFEEGYFNGVSTIEKAEYD